MNLKSSVEKMGKIVTQIIVFEGGNKKTFRGVKTETIEQGEFTKFETTDGRMVGVNKDNVDYFECFREE